MEVVCDLLHQSLLSKKGWRARTLIIVTGLGTEYLHRHYIHTTKST